MPIKGDSTEVSRLARKLDRLSSDFGRDSRRVLATAQRGMRTEASRSAIGIYAVGRTRVLQDLKVQNVDLRALSFELLAPRKPIPLTNYGARQNAVGLTFTVLRGQPRQTLRGGFLAKPRNGERNLPFKRAGRARLPIEVKYGPSTADMLNNAQVVAPLAELFFRRAKTELERLIERSFRG